jgi:signal transduction histidine kinase
LASFETLFAQKGIYCNIEIKNSKIFAMIDEYLMYQIFFNLMDNAIKFTSEGGVTVSIDSMKEKDILYCVVKLVDTGIGIQKDVVKFMFDAFRQGSEGLDRKFEGIGLGLTLTKKMVDLMDGRMIVESEVDKGTTFTLIFKGVEIDFNSEM